jgi:hypothetical protein
VLAWSVRPIGLADGHPGVLGEMGAVAQYLLDGGLPGKFSQRVAVLAFQPRVQAPQKA